MHLAYPRRRKPSRPADSFSGDSCPSRHTNVMEYKLEDELTLYDSWTEAVHILNTTAASIWRLCDGTNRVADIAGQFAQVYDLESAVAEADVREILGQFSEAGLLLEHSGGNPCQHFR